MRMSQHVYRSAVAYREEKTYRDLNCLQVLLMVSHELNTPLHEVLGCLDALISAEGMNALPEGTRLFAETAKTSAMQVHTCAPLLLFLVTWHFLSPVLGR